MRTAAGWWRSTHSKQPTARQASSAPRDCGARAACGRCWIRSIAGSRAAGSSCRGWAPAAWSVASSELWPVLQANPGDDGEAHRALRAQHRHFPLGEVRRARHGVEGIAVARDDAVLALGHRRRQELAELVVAAGILRPCRTAAHFVHRARLPEGEARGLHRAAEGARQHFADRNPKALHLRAELAGFGAALLRQIALVGAVFVALHRSVVLAEVRRGVAQVKDEAAFAQSGNNRRVHLVSCGAASEQQQSENKPPESHEQILPQTQGRKSCGTPTSLAALHTVITRGAKR